jgi:hypothetical protein
MTRSHSLLSRVVPLTIAVTMMAPAPRSLAVSQADRPADVVIVNGRVIDAESRGESLQNFIPA